MYNDFMETLKNHSTDNSYAVQQDAELKAQKIQSARTLFNEAATLVVAIQREFPKLSIEKYVARKEYNALKCTYENKNEFLRVFENHWDGGLDLQIAKHSFSRIHESGISSNVTCDNINDVKKVINNFLKPIV